MTCTFACNIVTILTVMIVRCYDLYLAENIVTILTVMIAKCYDLYLGRKYYGTAIILITIEYNTRRMKDKC